MAVVVYSQTHHIHTQLVEEEYKERGAECVLMVPVEFESDRITVDISLEGTVVGGGWKIQPFAPPVVSCLSV